MNEGVASRHRKAGRREGHRATILRRAFEVYDRDQSGAIDHEELRKLLEDLGWPSDDVFLKRAVNVLDADHSGEIEFSEFLKWTEFAYNSRVLYREEMCPSPQSRSRPRIERCEIQGREDSQVLASTDNQELAELWRKRTTLTTLHEGREAQNSCDGLDVDAQSVLKCDNKELYASEEEETDEDEAEAFQEEMMRTANVGGDQSGATRRQRERMFVNEEQEARNNGLQRRRTQREVEEDDFAAPIVKMATMALGTDKKAKQLITSRTRSQSPAVVCWKECDGRKRVSAERLAMGPRVRSKTTAHMRWACEMIQERTKKNEWHEEGVRSKVDAEDDGLDARAGKENVGSG
ncbi:Troponin C, isoform 1 [Gracilariopsis chorda]|uniref:Troponin C, isoform 1 n=1 Tax=Gracilariopsis chorda TaxID=448386 RepID=A0A2V3IDQ0_9FLOR|nr:Troponin C, isoform 1 [Gracilariopsis chorda]|eukprot:PXF40158.1 Troponin C, isoform 1 [Gracilariopsis chorda]